MSQLHDASSEARFQAFVEEFGWGGSATRIVPDRCGTTAPGLLLPGERKSVEPMAAITAALSHSRAAPIAAAFRRSIAFWSDETVLAKVASLVTPAIESTGSDRSLDYRRHQLFPKKGKHFCRAWRANIPANSVSRTIVRSPSRYPSQTMRRAFRSPIVSICLRTGPMIRRAGRKVGVPEDVVFKTKPMIALDQRSPPPAMRACRRASS